MRTLAYCSWIALAAFGCATHEVLPPSGDSDLDQLRHLAVNAPIDELTTNRMMFLGNVVTDYRHDEYLWRGMARLCDVVLADASLPDRRLFALGLAEAIQGGDARYTTALLGRVNELKALT